MTNNEETVVTEKIETEQDGYLERPLVDGFHISKYKSSLCENNPQNVVDRIVLNARQSLPFFRDPSYEAKKNQPSKVLCLGKVQSGKTSFFLATIALAFDNGYDAAYLLGGTKLRLKEQNLSRVQDVFQNNEKIRIYNVDEHFDEDLSPVVAQGFKVILVILKNPAKKTNLGKLQELANKYASLPSVVIDDEGDEYTPGAPKLKSKNGFAGKTHDKVSDIIRSFDVCTFLSVTATPQANLLLSTFDEVSPDRLVLVYPGDGYMGGRSFFDTKDNPHVRIIEDKDDFKDSIPDSFKDAFLFYLFSCCLKRSQGDVGHFSMLVHPSSFSSVQNTVASRINKYFQSSILSAVRRIGSIEWDDLQRDLKRAFEAYQEQNGRAEFSFETILKQLPFVSENLGIKEINYRKSADEDCRAAPLYCVTVGGNMLGRGLTIDRLIVSYIYRDSKIAQVDTMYQRCRWFGYKKSYFDICRVYMTSELQDKFMAIVSNEDDMWNSMESFLDSNIDFRKFRRIFELSDNRLVLTRRSVSNTVVLQIKSSGNKADECIKMAEENKKANRELCLDYCKRHRQEGVLIDFDDSPDHRQQHLVLKTEFTAFYKEFLSKLVYGYGSPFGSPLFFGNIVEKIKRGNRPDELMVLFMRFEKGEYRSPRDQTFMSISRLFQGRNDGTQFTGDRYPIDISGCDYSKMTFIQVHMVDIYHREPKIETSFPLLSFNDPLNSKMVRLVTGDNDYED